MAVPRNRNRGDRSTGLAIEQPQGVLHWTALAKVALAGVSEHDVVAQEFAAAAIHLSIEPLPEDGDLLAVRDAVDPEPLDGERSVGTDGDVDPVSAYRRRLVHFTRPGLAHGHVGPVEGDGRGIGIAHDIEAHVGRPSCLSLG